VAADAAVEVTLLPKKGLEDILLFTEELDDLGVSCVASDALPMEPASDAGAETDGVVDPVAEAKVRFL